MSGSFVETISKSYSYQNVPNEYKVSSDIKSTVDYLKEKYCTPYKG